MVWRSPAREQRGSAWCRRCRPVRARDLLAALEAAGPESALHGGLGASLSDPLARAVGCAPDALS
eukprot:306301-Lingulodinium_polyedra.AAC.1